MTTTSSKGTPMKPFFKIAKKSLGFLFLIISVITLITYSRDVSAGVVSGITLAVRSIIPSLFPFLILSDVFINQLGRDTGVFGRIFSRLLGMSPMASGAFLCGSFSGFPVGVKCASELYSHGNIKKEEVERLIGFVNNPSPAFVIAAVGTMRGSAKEGVILFISVILAAIITAFLFSGRSEKTTACEVKYAKAHFELVTSIKNAAYTSIGISSYIIFFSALLGIIDAIFGSYEITLFLSLFFEVGNAASLLAKSSLLPHVSLSLTAFALGFSGLSVFMQAKSLLPEDISMKKYIIMKLIQGAISALIALLIINLT